MSRLLPLCESKATCCPSGDHLGEAVMGAAKEVSGAGFEPSLLLTQISYDPERSDGKASRWPSGETWGLPSKRVEATSLDGAAAPEVPSSFRQMLTSCNACSYARRTGPFGPALRIAG